MPTEDAYSSAHLVMSHFGTCICSNVETNLSGTCLVSRHLSFEHLSVFLFCIGLRLYLCSVTSINWIVEQKCRRSKSILWYFTHHLTANFHSEMKLLISYQILQFLYCEHSLYYLYIVYICFCFLCTLYGHREINESWILKKKKNDGTPSIFFGVNLLSPNNYYSYYLSFNLKRIWNFWNSVWRWRCLRRCYWRC